MAGIYIHVPFCKTRCIYCDFFTKTDISSKPLYLEALCKEVALRAEYLGNEEVQTIYFGGGTPSQLDIADLQSVLKVIKDNFTIRENAEITLEANPDDLNPQYLDTLIHLGVNRLSIGIQSFDDSQLRFLNRRHNAEKALSAIDNSQKAGFNNISIDIMYGLPSQTIDIWERNLNIAIDSGIQHISSYHLIYEEDTKLYQLLTRERVEEIDEELSLDMFSLMINKLSSAGFIHYEISNFGKEGYLSRHNSSYWQNKLYLGLGSSAHSYNGTSRCWNISSIHRYIEAIGEGLPAMEEEILTEKEHYNDFILTGMRTMWGVSSKILEKQFGKSLLSYFEKNAQKHIHSGTMTFSDDIYKLTQKGIFVSDSVMSDLMYVD